MKRTCRHSICVRSSFIGFHRWPDAPEEVKYLRDLHRHKFSTKFFAEVAHGDRQLEFHQIQTKLNEVIRILVCKIVGQSPAMSCEMMACFIYDTMIDKFKVHGYKVVVSEDGENDGIYEVLDE